MPNARVGLCLLDAGLRNRISSMMAALEYEVVSADEETGPQPDLFLLDAACAARIGTQVLAQKSQSDLFLPVVVLLGREDQIDPWLESGYDDCLRAPVNESELNTKLKTLLGIRRRSEQFARECEAKHQVLFETTGTATILVGEDGTILRANQECLRVTGYSPDELAGTKWTRYVAPESLDMMLAYHKLRREDPGKAPSCYVAKMFNKAGQARDAMVHARLIPGTRQSVITIVDVTELRWKEEAIVRLGERWKQTFDSVRDPIWISDSEFGILQANSATEQLCGCSAAELVGRRCWELVHGSTGPIRGCPGLRVKETLTPDTCQIYVKGRYFEVSVDPIVEPSGQLSGLVHRMNDITESVSLHLELTQAQENFRRSLDESPIGVRIASLDDRTFYANPRYLELFGYSSLKELEAVPPVNLYTPKTYEEYSARQQRRLQGDPGPSEYEIEILRRDGQLRTLKVYRRPILWDGEQHFQILYEDVTEARRVEQAHRKLSTQFSALVDAIQDGLILVSGDLQVLWANRTAAQWAGQEQDAMLGQHCYRVLHHLEQPCDSCPTLRTFQTGDSQRETFSLAGGRLVEVRTFPVKEAGRVVSVVEVAEDRTEYKRLEAQYLQAQKMEAVGRLAGGVAHDFNNMLAIIRGYAEMMLEMLPPPNPLRECVENILKASQHSSDLVQQLLAVGRKQMLQPQVLDLNRLLADQEDLLRRLIGEDVELELCLARDLWRVHADPGQIQQVILNLVANARDAMAQGGKLVIETANVTLDELYAKSREDVKPGEYVQFTVSDNGCGMSAETLAKIFEPFFTTKGQGSGLGLATVHGIVKQSGGHISVYSELGKGTTFKVYLPRTAALAAPSRPRKKEAVLPGRGELILVVEDEPALSKLACEMLRRLGYRAESASSPAEALALVESGKLVPDLVLTDVVMPGMNGKAMVEAMRKAKPGLKAVFMSGYAENIIAHHGVLAPDTPFLQKPFRTADLAAMLREVLQPPSRNLE